MTRLLMLAISMLVTALMPLSVVAATREYTLTIGRQAVAMDGKARHRITVNGTIPGPVLHFTEGDDAVIHVTNTLDEDTSIHWHGLVVPASQDGVPGFDGFAGIHPGETFTYRFPVKQSGTYWYHAHSMGQEQDGLYSAMVIDPAPGSTDAVADAALHADRDYTVILSDDSAEEAKTIEGHLKASSDYYQYHRRTLGDLVSDAGKMGLGGALKAQGAWGRMRMAPTDLADVEGYSFLVNGLTPAQNWTGLFTPGQKVRLRLVNASSMTLYDVRIPGLKMTVVAADGQPVEPVTVDEFRFGNAETYDVIVEPLEDKAYTIAAEAIDRTGFAIATLAPRPGMHGDMPTQRPRARLTMADMNMAQMMKDDPQMDMSAMAGVSGWADAHAPAGTKILSYADLVYRDTQPDVRPPTRDITVRLGGNMQRYVWTIDGKTFDPAVGIHVAYNERVRLTYVNETMMAHPMHLHGMFVQLDNGQPLDKMPNKHTIIVPPGQSVSVILTANNEGTWALHCHLMYHMLSGMMTDLVVDKPGAAPPTPDPTPAETMNKMPMGDMPMGDMPMPPATTSPGTTSGAKPLVAAEPAKPQTRKAVPKQVAPKTSVPKKPAPKKPEKMPPNMPGMNMPGMDMSGHAGSKTGDTHAH